MPIYGYFCRECNHEFELLRSYAQKDDAAPCEQCHSQDTVRTLANVHVFVGSGANRRAAAGSSGCGSCSSAGHACSSCRSHS
jgi:putative FmdB family regulatory protein